MREICRKCSQREVAINYHKNGTTYYRSVCDHCSKKRIKSNFPWEKAGYKKKPHCDLCGFKSLYPTQMTVFHIDGDLNNIAFNNLRTICLNCVEVVKKKEVTWKRGDLQVDY